MGSKKMNPEQRNFKKIRTKIKVMQFFFDIRGGIDTIMNFFQTVNTKFYVEVLKLLRDRV